MIAAAGVLAAVAGAVLLWSAIADESPAAVVRSALNVGGAENSPPSPAPDASTGIGPR